MLLGGVVLGVAELVRGRLAPHVASSRSGSSGCLRLSAADGHLSDFHLGALFSRGREGASAPQSWSHGDRIQSARGNRTASKERSMGRVEEDWGEWGTIYSTKLAGCSARSRMGLAPVPARGRPAGRAALARRRARDLTCWYLTSSRTEWVAKSLLLDRAWVGSVHECPCRLGEPCGSVWLGGEARRSHASRQYG